MLLALPAQYFLVAGYAEGVTPLNAFDNALMRAGIGNVNLIRISSILPPSARWISPPRLPYGALVPTAYAEETSTIRGTLVSAAVACGVPEDPSLPGVIMEHHQVGEERQCREDVIRKVEEAFSQRKYRLADVKTASASGIVENIGSVVAAVALWA